MCICIVIHGTWGSRSDFAFTDSLFCRAIKGASSSDIKFERFEWSGKNSATERTQAAKQLRLFINNIPCSEGPVYIIAHSHGGNVAIEAIRGDDIEQRVRGVVTLGTPFLSNEVRKFISFLRTDIGVKSIEGLSIGIVILATVATVGAFMGFLPWYFGVFGAPLYIAYFKVSAMVWGDWEEDSKERLSQFMTRIEEAHSTATEIPLRASLLVIHSNMDEALWWLTRLFAFVNMPYTLLSSGLAVLGSTFILLVFIRAVYLASGSLEDIFPDLINQEIVESTFISVVVFFLASTATILVFGIFLVIFTNLVMRLIGSKPAESIWKNLIVQKKATQFPCFSCASIDSLSAPFIKIYGGLWHSKYARSGAVVDKIASQIDLWNSQ